MPSAPPKPAPPKAAPSRSTPGPSQGSSFKPARSLSISSGVSIKAHKVVIYGPGGVGKSELASLMKDVDVTPLFIDIENSTQFLDVHRIDPTPETWEEVIEAIRMVREAPQIGAVVIDSFTKLEELAADYTVRTVRHENGNYVANLAGYGFGKGTEHLFNTFQQVISELDDLAKFGKHVVAIAHDCTSNVPNPGGEDWIRYEPRLQSPKNGKCSIRHRVKEWCDHLFYIGFDTYVSDAGKAQGGGTRTIYPAEMPTHWAKSRKLQETMPYNKGDSSLWQVLFGE